MKWSDILPWLKIFELQTTEEEVIHGLSYDAKGKKRQLPPPARIREIVNERIKERREKPDGQIE